jgi:hypothetical protein
MPDEESDHIVHAFGVELFNMNLIADHIDEMEGGDWTISFDKSWTDKVHLVHLIDLSRVQEGAIASWI